MSAKAPDGATESSSSARECATTSPSTEPQIREERMEPAAGMEGISGAVEKEADAVLEGALEDMMRREIRDKARGRPSIQRVIVTSPLALPCCAPRHLIDQAAASNFRQNFL